MQSANYMEIRALKQDLELKETLIDLYLVKIECLEDSLKSALDKLGRIVNEKPGELNVYICTYSHT